MNEPTASPSLQDGYHGAADACILEYWAACPASVTPKLVNVQCTRKTKDLLKRAGYKRTRWFDAYPVRVTRDAYNRLQLAPIAAPAPAAVLA